jgi:hydrogenase/urease accessory protein HupE
MKTAMTLRSLLWFFLLWCGLAASAQAHMTTPGQMTVLVKPAKQQIDVLLSIQQIDVLAYFKVISDKKQKYTLKPEVWKKLKPRVAAYFTKGVEVYNDITPCKAFKSRFLPHRAGRFYFFLEMKCDEPLEKLLFKNTVLFDDVGGYKHFGRIQIGKKLYTTIFSKRLPGLPLKVSKAYARTKKVKVEGGFWSTLGRYTFLGFWHILEGIDHVLFVIALLLAGPRWKQLLAIVTAFTIGHSVTLALSAMRWFTLPAKPIEAIIALSILYIAIENFLLHQKQEEPKHRYLVTLLFGLIHGFGFSYVLRDQIGLPQNALVPALASFNVGVELGQLAILALVVPLWSWVRKQSMYEKAFLVANSAIGAMALVWLIERTLL